MQTKIGAFYSESIALSPRDSHVKTPLKETQFISKSDPNPEFRLKKESPFSMDLNGEKIMKHHLMIK